MDDPQRYTTPDVNQGAYLLFNGEVPTLEKKPNGRVFFVFKTSQRLWELLERYNSNEAVPITDFVSCLKGLRSLMISKREEAE